MKTLLLPTTVGVNEAITMKEALEMLKSNGIMFEVTGDIVDGMYVADNGEIVAEQLLPITSNMLSADVLATMFTQECILESTETEAKLVAQNGDVWADYNVKIEYNVNEVGNALELQEKLARHFGGASRQNDKIWAWGNADTVATWAN